MRTKIIAMLLRMRRTDERGLSLLEYAAGAAVLLAAVIAAMEVFSSGLNSFFLSLQNWLTSAGTGINALNNSF